jgi:hypothetical protein
MQVFLSALVPSLHTPEFIRRTSPFLTTVLSATAAAFCPSSSHLVPALEQHAIYLSTFVYLENLKSVEIVAALCILSAWSRIDVTVDRSWQLMKQAAAIASELQLHLPTPPSVLAHYCQITGLSIDSATLAALERSREQLQQVLFGLELTMSIQRGQIQSMLPIPGLKGSACENFNALHGLSAEPTSDDYAHYLHASNLTVNQITVRQPVVLMLRP